LYTIEAFAGEVSGLEVSCSSTGANPSLQFDEWRASMRAGDAQGRLLLSWNARPMENRLEVRGTDGRKIGRAHVCTPVTNAHLVCRLLLYNTTKQHTMQIG